MDEVRWLKERLNFEYRVTGAIIFRAGYHEEDYTLPIQTLAMEWKYDAARSNDALLAVLECIQNSTIADHDDL